MKTRIITMMLAILFLPSLLMAQDKDKQAKNDPDEKIIVNKEYDENGNLIRYDSTYTFEWHGDTMMVFPNGEGSFFSHDFFSGSNDMISKFFSDSLFHISPFGYEWNNEFFKDKEDFFQQFDRDFFDHFTWNPDSLKGFQWNDSTFSNSFPKHFSFPDMSEFFKNYEEFQNDNQPFFDNKDQHKEWEEIIKRYQKEMEQFYKK